MFSKRKREKEIQHISLHGIIYEYECDVEWIIRLDLLFCLVYNKKIKLTEIFLRWLDFIETFDTRYV